MAVILSKALVDDLMAGRAVVNAQKTGTGIAFVDGGGGNDSITDTGNGLGIFHVGDMLTVKGAAQAGNNNTFEILSVAAGTIEVATGSLTTEGAGNTVSLASARGHSMADIFKYGVLRLYGTPRPASPEAAETGTLLLEITESSGAWEDDVDTNGLKFDNVVDGVLSKDGTQIWSGVGLADGTVVWGRFYDNRDGDTTGADGTEVLRRFDFDVAQTSADMTMATSVTTGNTKTIDEFNITLPLTPA